MIMLKRQPVHFLLLAALVAIVAGVAQVCPEIRVGNYAGLSTTTWLVIALAVPIAHQVYVAFCWGAQLHRQLLTRTLGRAAFPLFATGFAVLGLSRLATLIALAISNAGSLDIIAPAIAYVLAALLAIPFAATMYSVAAYFGFARAMGLDHFDPARAHETPFVRRGIFRFSSNAMYVFGFLGAWIPAFAWRSEAALLAAAFQHAYIWVHYYCTELPDIRRIYGEPPAA